MNYVLYGGFSVLSAILLTLMSYKMFQIFQLSSYRIKGVVNWFKITKGDYVFRYFAAAFFSFIAMFVFVGCFHRYKAVQYLGLLFYLLFTLLFIFLTVRPKQNKTPLVFTMRIMRFVAVSFLLFMCASFGLFVLGRLWSERINYTLIGLLPIFIPLITALAHLIIVPFEILNNYGYRRRAEKKLVSMPGLIRIGITGSYGKTTAKNILAAILSQKYKVCYSPSSYNTPMGISKVVNNQLSFDDQIFIAEMGARNRGDIAELASIVNPNYGLITSIGNQHLETFGTRQAIIDTKFELIESLVAGGMAFFNGDSPDTRDMYGKTHSERRLTGAETLENVSFAYRDVTVGTSGTTFTLVDGNQSVTVHTKLLGKHIPSLIALCAAVSAQLGISLEKIAEACKELEPVPHRLQLIENGDSIIIDDAYNSNTEGAKNALLILGAFEGRSRVVVTPGMVELGMEEKQANETFGAQIAASADYAILVGSRGEDIQRGALSADMPQERIIRVTTLTEAVAALSQIEGAKAVLFENDLPDNY